MHKPYEHLAIASYGNIDANKIHSNLVPLVSLQADDLIQMHFADGLLAVLNTKRRRANLQSC